MDTLGKLITALLIGAVILVLIPIVGAVLALFGGLAVFLIWLLPIWIIARSDQTYTGEKVAWILAIICLSWFAWIFYFFLAPIKPREDDYEPRRRHYRY